MNSCSVSGAMLRSTQWAPQLAARQSNGLLSCLLEETNTRTVATSREISREPDADASPSSATELAGLAAAGVSTPRERPDDELQGPRRRYEAMIARGELRQDAKQAVTVNHLERVYQDLLANRRRSGSGLTLVDASGIKERKSGWWGSLVDSLKDKSQNSSSQPTRGLYMYGGPGCGKTMLMDMFAASLPRDMAKALYRIHYHDFMLEVHESLQEHRATPDPLRKVSKDIAAKSTLICLDELFVNDIADATILHRLFDDLWSRNVTLVTTSNRHPDKLYENGLQRQLFLPFIETIKERCMVHDMESDRDYRKLAHHAEGLYFTGSFREEELEDRFMELTNKNPIGTLRVDVDMGRELQLRRVGGCVAYETFKSLCERPLGAADYMALARAKHTLALSGIPVFDEKSKPFAYRFVTLIDILYENRIRLICSAEGSPEELFENIQVYDYDKVAEKERGTTSEERDSPEEMDSTTDKRSMSDKNLVVDDNLGFVKDRTISRLIEMQSNEYLVDHATMHAPELLKALVTCPDAKRFARYTGRTR